MDICAVDLFASIGLPVASGLKAAGEILPEPPAAVFSGTPVLLFGEAGSDSGRRIDLTWDGGRLSLPVDSGDEAAGETIRLLQGAASLPIGRAATWPKRLPALWRNASRAAWPRGCGG